MWPLGVTCEAPPFTYSKPADAQTHTYSNTNVKFGGGAPSNSRKERAKQCAPRVGRDEELKNKDLGESPEASDEEEDGASSSRARGGRGGAGGDVEDDWEINDEDAKFSGGSKGARKSKGLASGGQGGKGSRSDSAKQGLLDGHGGRRGSIDAEFD